jgi:hypothetical protein
VLDSTPLLDAVATQDTVIQLRAAIRKLLTVADRADPELAGAVRTALTRDDDDTSLGKPPCDWDDPKAREALVDALVQDANAALDACDGSELDGTLSEAVELLALEAAQDVEAGDDGVFRIARRVARDRLISRYRSPPWTQVARADLRWLQVPSRYRPRRRADHRSGRHPGQRRRP